MPIRVLTSAVTLVGAMGLSILPLGCSSQGSEEAALGTHVDAIVGNGRAYSPVVVRQIVQATGSFPSMTNVTSETDAGSNNFTVQLNTNRFDTSVCAGMGPNCKGWQQFVFSNAIHAIWLEEYLLNSGYPTFPCPAAFEHHSTTDGYCRHVSSSGSNRTIPGIDITELTSVSLVASASPSGDEMQLTTPDGVYTASETSVLDLANSQWNSVEFNVFGSGARSRAAFNDDGATLGVGVSLVLDDDSQAEPACQIEGGTTGETNNLTLVSGSCCPAGGPPRITFLESNDAAVRAPYCPLTNNVAEMVAAFL